MENELNKREMAELTADVVAIVKRQREAQTPKYSGVIESMVGAMRNDARCKEKGGRV